MRLKNNRKSSNLLVPLVVALALNPAASTLAQNVVVTNLAVPGATTVWISALNQTGQVAGVYTLSDGVSRTFFWSPTSLYDVGSLGGGSAEASTLNNAGAVVGQSSTATPGQTHAFLFNGSVLSDVGPAGSSFSSAIAINDLGQVAGYYMNGPLQHAFVSSGGTLTDLGTLGGSMSFPVAINNAGQVAGESTAADGRQHAFLFSDGVMLDLGALGGVYSLSTSLNSTGQVTGMAGTADGSLHAFLGSSAAMLDLGTLGGTFSIGYVVNEAGHVVGDSMITADAENHAFLFSDGAMHDLGTLGGDFSSPIGLNNRDQVVGMAADATGVDRAFLWQNGAMLDLNSLLPAGSGWSLDAAYYINDNGQIVGTGAYLGQPGWFLMETAPHVNQPPIANAGSDRTIDCAGANTAVTLDGSASSDPDGDALSYEWRHGQDVLATAPTVTVALELGSYTFTLRVTDPHGAMSEATMVVTCVDHQPPVVQCPAGTTASADQRGQAVVPDFLAGTVASDGCTPGTLLTRTQNPAAGTTVAGGTTVVVVSVSDSSGNSSTCTTTFTVVDTTAPTVQCPAAVTVSAGLDGQGVVPNCLAGLVCSDNCTPAASLAMSQTPAAGTRVGPGTMTVVVSVTDAAGNTTSCNTSFTVTAAGDTTPPVVQCPAGVSAVANRNGRAGVPNFLNHVVASDNVTPAESLVKSQRPLAGTRVEVGTTIVVVTVTDAAGNTSTCSTTFTVIAQDTTPPTVQCPAPVTVSANREGTAAIPNLLGSLVMSDNVTPVHSLNKSQSPAAGTRVPRGIHRVTVTVTDDAGNATTCTTSVTVVDTTAPKISALSATPDKLTTLNHQMVPVTLTAMVQDNCDPMPTCRIISVTSNETSGNPGVPDWAITGAMTLKLRAEQNDNSTRRVYTITVQARDDAGNVSTDTVKVNTARK